MKKMYISVEYYLGRKLTAGSYFQWMSRLKEIIDTIVTDNAQFNASRNELTPLLQKMALLIKQLGAFADTPAVSAADKWRDSLLTIIYMHIYYCSLLPTESCLYAAAAKLFPKVKPYKSLQRHEMTQETSEINGMLRVLTAAENAAAVEVLGLTTAVNELAQQNTIIQNEMVKREQEDAERKQMKDGETTATLRQQIEPIYEVLVQIINALVIMGNATALAAVPQMNAVIDHYQQIQAQKDGGANTNASGGGFNNGTTDPGTTTDPTNPGTGGGDNPSDPGTGGGGGTTPPNPNDDDGTED